MSYSKEEMLHQSNTGEVWVHYCKSKKTSVEIPRGQFCIWCKLTEQEYRIQRAQTESVRTWFKEG